ncbi:MAG: methylated-DNA--[protein]-cysteine S-methyltransferase [Tepidisphaera sp.]|nr:methylated-DNA--[protein]-cysteine S-methyltransferase [Tepidisphaera sp.]
MNHAQPIDETAQSWSLETPLGPMRVCIDATGDLTQVTFTTDPPGQMPMPTPPAVVTLLMQLDEFARGQRDVFDLPLAARGSPFERSVWRETSGIPRGHTTSYAAIATALGQPRSAARAVGGALGRNPWHVIVPCHRVIGRDGRLTGYAAGVHIKQRLLELEGASLTAPHASE